MYEQEGLWLYKYQRKRLSEGMLCLLEVHVGVLQFIQFS